MREKQTCQAECEIYSRVTGYHRPLKNWNKGKQEEFKGRLMFSLDKVEVELAKPSTYKVDFDNNGDAEIKEIS